MFDPFTGTGTFIVRLLQSGLIKPEDLTRKYKHELHANEIVLLAYYVAAINIEETFHGLNDGTYEPFPGIVLTDTFQTTEDDDRYDDGGIFGDNNERVKAQSALDIRVIVGNPPYSSGQDSANDNNQNVKYRTLDARIAATYAAKSTAQNKNSLYDSYIRAIRWASDRIKDRGVVAFVSNGGFLDGNTADGLRKSLTEEFSSLYVFNLRGNTRNSGEQARKEGGQTFGAGSRATIAISILVMNPVAAEHGRLYYRDIGDYLTRERKLGLIAEYGSLSGVPWESLEPNEAGDWINRRDNNFGIFRPIGDKGSQGLAVFTTYSAGLKTNRDAWVYNSSIAAIKNTVNRMIAFYIEQSQALAIGTIAELSTDSARIAWGGGLKTLAVRNRTVHLAPDSFRSGAYRPFQRQHVVFESDLIERRYQLPKMFPTAVEANFGLYTTAAGSGHPFAAMAVNAIPDLAFWGSGSGQFFPRYTFEPRSVEGELDLFDDGEEYRRVDNITDEIFAEYRELYGSDVTRDDIFFFVYGLLHSPDYRETYAADLRKMLPRIPNLADASAFRAFAKAGLDLSKLHLDYESVEQFPLDEIWASPVTQPIEVTAPEKLRVTKMKFGGKAGAWDKSTIIYNEHLALRGIPKAAEEYMLGSRSAIEWILERYQVKTDKDSGIVNDPNDWGEEHGNPRYILDLLKSIVTVSVETVRIVNSLPALAIADDVADEATEDVA